MKITFLLPLVSQPRFHKRIAALKELGAKIEIIAFERDYYPGKPLPESYLSLGNIEHERYIARI